MVQIKKTVAQLLLASAATALPTGSETAKPAVDTDMVYDAIVVGGGPAGLSAVSGLARVNRNVLLIDSGKYRNDATRHMHDVIGNDGIAPAYFRYQARRQLNYYSGATMVNGTVTKIDVPQTAASATGNAPFIVRATFEGDKEAVVSARGIILATGLNDILPSTPGIAENWGKGIYWCPWCDGNEHANQPLGILSNLLDAASSVQEISTLNKDIICFVNGTDTPEMRAATEKKFPNWQQYLDLNGITVENSTITNLTRLADGSINEHPDAPTFPEHDLFRVDLEDGRSVERAAFFASFPNEQHSDLGAEMGVQLLGGRLFANSSRGLMTNIENVYAIGDANSDNVTNVPHAMFSGKRAAVFLHVQLARFETATILAENTTVVAERDLELDPRSVWATMNGGAADVLDAGEWRE